MAADRGTILSWLADLSVAMVTDAEDLADVSARIVAAADLSADALAPELLALMRIVAESADAPEDFDRVAVPATVTSMDTREAMAVLVAMGLSIAGGRVAWPSRPMARRARSRVAASGEMALAAVDRLGGDGADLYAWLSAIVAVSCRLISDLAADAAPIVKVKTGLSQPSTVLAYQLYGDATRAAGLVDIAGASTPLVMPTLFDALAS